MVKKAFFPTKQIYLPSTERLQTKVCEKKKRFISITYLPTSFEATFLFIFNSQVISRIIASDFVAKTNLQPVSS